MKIAGVADIGATNTRIALIRDDFSILASERFETPKGNNPYEIPDLVGEVISRLCRFFPKEVIEGIGVSVAGPVDLNAGSIIHPPNMPFDEVPIVRPLTDSLGCPVLIMNDCRAAVLGEVFAGAGRGKEHVVYITISTGIGGGVYSGGKVLVGRGGNAGEIGHFTVDTSYLHPCSCGCTGHWEGYASGKGIPDFFQKWCEIEGFIPSSPSGTAKEILTAAALIDPIATRFIQTLAQINARGLSTVIVAYDPGIIILDGPVVTSYPDLILTPALRYIDRYLDIPEIVISPLKGNAPILGAAALVFSSYSSRDQTGE
jgi:glucokinase